MSPLVNLVLSLFIAQSVGAQHLVFHGTSVVILPPDGDTSPKNSDFLTSNFISYAAPEGYVSYGWWLPARMSSNSSHCVPEATSYHWVEFANGTCNWSSESCLYSIENHAVRDPPNGIRTPPVPASPVHYIVKPLHIGNGEYGDMALSYVDEEDIKAYGIGTRQILSGTSDEDNLEKCRKALKGLQRVVKEFQPMLSFELGDPCKDGIVDGVNEQVRLGEEL